MVPPNTDVRVAGVYWVNTPQACPSMLRDVTGITVDASTSQGLDFTLLRGQIVQTRPDQCGGVNVPGGIINVRQTSRLVADETRVV